jgi:hypothetical protein
MSIEPVSLKPLVRVLEDSGYAQFSAPGDRHGSWEWPFFRTSKDLTRFVTLAATPVDGHGTLQVELWVGAQAADQRSVRELVHARRISSGELLGAVGDLTKQTEHAVRQAGALKLADLIPSPLSPGDDHRLGAGHSPRLARR